MIKCNCKDWEPNMNIINGWQGLSMAHGDMTGIKSFKYCPYCGKILKEKNNI